MTSENNPGLGTLPSDSDIVVCIGNRPSLPEFENLTKTMPLLPGDIDHIVRQTGNHWRKIFNIYAKLLFELNLSDFSSWQHYRDEVLLQAGNKSCLLFSDPLSLIEKNDSAVLITGKGYAEQLGLFDRCVEIENGIYKDPNARLFVTPYFDYRQLSNAKLSLLVKFINASKV